MLEYHGWITVRETAADDDDGGGLRQIVNELGLTPPRWTARTCLTLG
ncbi:immunity 7 family protein [Streptomyces sp. AD2-2]|nr:immunity 7 family protein [Streptomyces sp. AD2-2]